MQFAKLKDYVYLMRFHKPVGILLLLLPALWALWLAGNGKPDYKIVGIFVLGVVIMRAAGCVINDIADKNFDKHVARTYSRPLTCDKISMLNALMVFGVLMLAAFLLVLSLNALTIFLAFIAAAVAIVYPFMKRFTHLPQLGLGIAFSFSVPMAFAALTNSLPEKCWLLFSAAVVWPIIYDTMYALVDYEDDIKIGIKSTAILFKQKNLLILSILQMVFLTLLMLCGILFHLKIYYFVSLFMVAGLFVHQLRLIKDHNRENCFRAFISNQWVGMILFIGILLSYVL